MPQKASSVVLKIGINVSFQKQDSKFNMDINNYVE